jgi:hypothetical protein
MERIHLLGIPIGRVTLRQVHVVNVGSPAGDRFLHLDVDETPLSQNAKTLGGAIKSIREIDQAELFFSVPIDIFIMSAIKNWRTRIICYGDTHIIIAQMS